MKKFYLVLGTVLLGALGSGLWELAVSPLISWLGSSVWDFVVEVSTSVERSIYIAIAENRQETIKMISGGVALIVSYLTISNFYNLKPSSETKIEIICDAGLVVSLVFITIIYVAKNEYIQEKVEDSYHLMVIIKPHVSDKEFDHLKSKFALIESKSDYELIMTNLKNIAKANNVKLPSRYES